MNQRIRTVGLVLTLLFVVLAGQLTYLQLVEAEELSTHPGNVRNVLRTYAEPRGPILSADEQVLAHSVGTDTEFRFRRLYPTHSLFGHITGMFSFTYGATGVESTYNDDLSGRSEDLRFRNIGDLLIGKDQAGSVVLTIDSRAQIAARDALAGRAGSVVALNPKTGEVLAMYSQPSFDPEPLSGHDQAAVRTSFEALSADPNNPMRARAWLERYPPGSTFKIVTATSALEHGVATPEREFPVLKELDLPQTDRTLRNFGNSDCGGTFIVSFVRSCNTTFAQLGLELGENLVTTMSDFGIGQSIPLDLKPSPVTSIGPQPGAFQQNQPKFAQAGIGQGDVDVTPLQMALITSAIANGGVIMEPYVVREVRDVDGVVVDRADPEAWRTACSPETAAIVKDLMVQVVAGGTGTRGQIPGVTVAGKTGTAQAPGGPPHTWFVAFAPAEDPVVAVAVIVERGGDIGDEATGGRVAAPVAQSVMQAVLQSPPPVAG